MAGGINPALLIGSLCQVEGPALDETISSELEDMITHGISIRCAAGTDWCGALALVLGAPFLLLLLEPSIGGVIQRLGRGLDICLDRVFHRSSLL